MKIKQVVQTVVAGSLLTVSIATAATIKLSWEYPDATNPQEGFKVERRVGVTGNFTEVGSTPKLTLTFDDTNAQTGQVYCYKVRAFLGNNFSAYSNEACGAALIAPVMLKIIGVE